MVASISSPFRTSFVVRDLQTKAFNASSSIGIAADIVKAIQTIWRYHKASIKDHVISATTRTTAPPWHAPKTRCHGRRVRVSFGVTSAIARQLHSYGSAMGTLMAMSQYTLMACYDSRCNDKTWQNYESPCHGITMKPHDSA